MELESEVALVLILFSRDMNPLYESGLHAQLDLMDGIIVLCSTLGNLLSTPSDPN